MAVLKHIKSKNANYSDAIDYLLFQHDENNGKKILDDSGRPILREEYYIDGLLCTPESFDKECEITNKKFHKNQKASDIKSHHYIISYDPADVTDCGLTGKKAQALSLALAKKIFPGYQTLVVTHTDGHNNSGNIHTHIVINSVRKYTAERAPYMSQPHDHEAGYKHRSTDKFTKYFKKEIMDMCQEHGLHQVDLLSPAEKKITNREYRLQQSGQKKLDKINQEIIDSGLKPTSEKFQTQKQYLRDAIDECAPVCKNFEEFQSVLFEKYQISVTDHRGRYSYLHPERNKRITERALGTRYGKEHLEQVFLQKDPLAIIFVKSHLRLVVDLQTNIKAMQNPAYANKVKITNLKQMANTIIYLQKHDIDNKTSLESAYAASYMQQQKAQDQVTNLSLQLKDLNQQIHYTGQYLSNKKTYTAFSNSKSKGLYRKNHASEIQAYETARDWLKQNLSEETIPSLKKLYEKKSSLQLSLNAYKDVLSDCKSQVHELDVVRQNVDSILNHQTPEYFKTSEQVL